MYVYYTYNDTEFNHSSYLIFRYHAFKVRKNISIGCSVSGTTLFSGLKMSELSDEASESEQLGASLSLWLGDSLVRPEELDVPLDLHTACSIGQYDVVAECIKKWGPS